MFRKFLLKNIVDASRVKSMTRSWLINLLIEAKSFCSVASKRLIRVQNSRSTCFFSGLRVLFYKLNVYVPPVFSSMAFAIKIVIIHRVSHNFNSLEGVIFFSGRTFERKAELWAFERQTACSHSVWRHSQQGRNQNGGCDQGDQKASRPQGK